MNVFVVWKEVDDGHECYKYIHSIKSTREAAEQVAKDLYRPDTEYWVETHLLEEN